MDILSDKSKREIQMKLGHYLSGYRKSRRMTQDEMATTLGYSLSQYKRTELGLEGRVSNAVEFLAVFASITEKSVPEFVQYLQEIPPEQRANLAESEMRLLSGFSKIPLDTRREFIQHYCNDKKEKLQPLVEIGNSLLNLSSTQLTVIQFMVSILSPSSENIQDKESKSELIGKVRQLLDVYEKSVNSGEAVFPTTI